jgi:hypothetical protein
MRLIKTEAIHRRSSGEERRRRRRPPVERVDWQNTRRLHTACHDVIPVEHKQVSYGQHPPTRLSGSQHHESQDSPAQFTDRRCPSEGSTDLLNRPGPVEEVARPALMTS